MYNFAALDPRTSNEDILSSGPGVFGIEVTVPALADRCTLGNLDPQHAGGEDIPACVAALDCEVPPDGTTLATIRPDADSVTAMAVLQLRSAGSHIDRRIVYAVGDGDCAPRGPWRRGYVQPAEFMIANSIAMDHAVPLPKRVEQMMRWLRDGHQPPAPQPVDISEVSVTIMGEGRYAVVRADGEAGRDGAKVGYQYAPVLIIVNDWFTGGGRFAPHLKYTICRWNEDHPMDWQDLHQELEDMEPGWGGSKSILGSPQGMASVLPLKQVVEVVRQYLV